MENLPTEETADSSNTKAIQSHFHVKDVMFEKGIQYVHKVLDGESKTRAYLSAFGVELKTARTNSGEFHRRKWVQELLRYFSPDLGTLYIGDIDSIIETAMTMIKDNRRDDRVRIEAMKAVQPFIKQMVVKEETNINIIAQANPAEAVMTQMQKAIEQLSASGKMIGQGGEIIDVTEVI